MNKKYSILPVGVGLAVIFTVVMFLGFLDNDGVVLEQNNVPQYIPSNITKANPNILVGGGDTSYSTIKIEDVKDDVKYTIEGTILSIGDPIDWYESDSALSGHGSIPVTMSVENVYKGSIDSKTFTFFLRSFIHYTDIALTTTISEAYGKNKTYYLWSFEPQFEIGEKVLVHIYESYVNEEYFVDSEDRKTMTPHPIIKLGKYGAYHIQEGMAFNEKYSDGISVNQSIQESQP